MISRTRRPRRSVPPPVGGDALIDRLRPINGPLRFEGQTHAVFALGQEVNPRRLALLPEGQIHSRLVPHPQPLAAFARALAQHRHALPLEGPKVVFLLAPDQIDLPAPAERGSDFCD